jgi:TRAP-type mannitol/chloroaromatic compound transport system permease small subunit
MGLLRRITHSIDWINEQVGRGVSWLTVAMVLDVFAVVVLRYLFDVGWVWMQELYVWSHATVFMLGAGYTLLHDGHVRIDLIYRGASKRYKAVVDIIGSLFLAGPLLFLVFNNSERLILRSWENMEKSAEAGGLPGVFLLKTVIAVFCVLFGLQVLALFLRSFETLLGFDDKPDFKDGDDEGVML